MGCSEPDYRCDVDICVQATEIPCCLCYSQCMAKATDGDAETLPNDVEVCLAHLQWSDAELCRLPEGGL